MNILGVFATHGAQAAQATKAVDAASSAEAASARQGVGEVHDAVALSVDGVKAAEATSDIRFDRVAAIRAAIADGSYETPEKLDIALDRLLDSI